MKTKIYSLFAILTLSVTAWSQGVGINETGNNPDPSAILDVESTDKGFLPPRMTTTERNGITSPATGLIIYNTTESCVQINNGTPASPVWECMFTLSNTGAVVQNIRVVSNPTASDWLADDYTIVATGTGAIGLPDPTLASNVGRIINLRNGASINRTIGTNPPFNNATLGTNRGMILQSDGVQWWVIGGF